MTMTAEQIETLFTRRDGQFAFARWGRPIAPVAFGIEEAALPVVKGALEAVAKLAGHDMVETDPELGSNLMMFFFADWAELLDVPGMDAIAAMQGLGANDLTKDIPVIAISADAGKNYVGSEKTAGFKAHLTKPINLREVIEAVKKELDA